MKKTLKNVLKALTATSLLVALAGCSTTGPQGEQGVQGPQGETGVAGQDGQTPFIGENGNWWIGTTDTGVKAQGAQGLQGETGVAGQDGQTPFIGENGNWWIGTTDTGVKAQGAQGPQGETGVAGQNGQTPFIGENGNWWIGTTDTGVKAQGAQGEQGVQGPQGETGVAGQDGQTPFIGENGNWWIGTTDTGVKAQGAQGEQGVQGSQGETGADFWESNPQGLDFYPLDDGTYGVSVGNAKYLSSITIPSTFRNANVTRIVENGFSNLRNLTTISIPNTITSIEEYAFYNSENLNSIIIDDEEIAVYSFNGTANIENINVGENAFINTDLMEVTIFNSDDNDTIVECTVKNRYSNISKLKVSAALNSHTDIEFTNEVDLTSSDCSFELDFGTYGLFKDIDCALFDGENVAYCDNISGVSVSADHYNISHLNGTYPVLVYTLQLNSITNNGEIPTFVSLERTAAYDWNELPYNIQTWPFLTRSEGTTSNFHGIRAGIANYVKELYEINNNSTFSLYIVDNYTELAIEFLVANQIPETNYDVTLLSDGAGTAYNLVHTYGNIENPSEKNEQMFENFEEVAEYFYVNGNYSNRELYDMLIEKGSNTEYSVLQYYAYVMTKYYSNVNWIVNRLRPNENLKGINADFVTEIQSNVKQVYTNNLLSALSPEETEIFKNLYHFNDEMFGQCEVQNKEAMVILGTSWSGESGVFYDYLKMTMEFYGDQYVYYYKGHPGYPTNQYQGRQDALDKLRDEGLEVYELDNAIAAELIMFFYPNIYLSGWQSSTFDSASDERMVCSLYNVSFAGQSTFTYGGMVDYFFTKITPGSSEYEGITLDSETTYYLIEYNNKCDEQLAEYNLHEIAIYNAETLEILYYKLINDVYVNVTSTGVVVE